MKPILDTVDNLAGDKLILKDKNVAPIQISNCKMNVLISKTSARGLIIVRRVLSYNHLRYINEFRIKGISQTKANSLIHITKMQTKNVFRISETKIFYMK